MIANLNKNNHIKYGEDILCQIKVKVKALPPKKLTKKRTKIKLQKVKKIQHVGCLCVVFFYTI